MSSIKNISQIVRDLDYAGKAVFTEVGEALKEGLEKEFAQLVNETAQYTGTTAASWNITVGGVGDQVSKGQGGVRPQPFRTRAEALSVGHQNAVGIALAANAGTLESLVNWIKPGQKGHKPGAIMVENYAPGADRAEEGPLRDVNESAIGAFERFKVRVTDLVAKNPRETKI